MTGLRFIQIYIYTGFLVVGLVGCGKSDKGGGAGPAPLGKVKTQFSLVAAKYKIPVRLMMAAGFVESNLSPYMSTVPYFSLGGDGGSKDLGFHLTETAFGISRSELGLSSETADLLEAQIDAYGAWLRRKLDESGSALPVAAASTTDKFRWIWEMSKFHRHGEELKRNIRILWSKSVIQVLNDGATWQDPDNGELLELNPEASKILENQFPPEGQALFKITDDISDISNARRFELTSESVDTLRNNPRKIKVIHCPLGLSACLELQDSTVDSKVKLGAHYVIPQDKGLVLRALQIKDHERRVKLTAADGSVTDVKDAIVIMLVGNSGRYVDGLRVDANPTWFTPYQLRSLAAVVSGVCKVLSQDDASIDYTKCITPEAAEGVEFYHQSTRSTYRWGDIPDYDKSIFWGYLSTNESNIRAEATLSFAGDRRRYSAGEVIRMNTHFVPGVKWLRLQRAVRCDDGKLVWDTMRTDPIRSRDSWPLEVSIWDSGPNKNGRQFVRVLVYGAQNELMGWAVDQLYLSKYDDEFSPPSEACYFND